MNLDEPTALRLELELIDRDLASLIGWQRRDRCTIDPLLDRRNELAVLIGPDPVAEAVADE